MLLYATYMYVIVNINVVLWEAYSIMKCITHYLVLSLVLTGCLIWYLAKSLPVTFWKTESGTSLISDIVTAVVLNFANHRYCGAEIIAVASPFVEAARVYVYSDNRKWQKRDLWKNLALWMLLHCYSICALLLYCWSVHSGGIFVLFVNLILPFVI